MTESDGERPSKSASGHANVGFQAHDIYGSVSVVHVHEAPYDAPDGASAEERFRIGVKNLNGGRASKARTLIWEAITNGYETSEARFYWLIAMLSERTVGQFSAEEVKQLSKAAEKQPAISTDSWEDGTRLIFQLLESVQVLPSNPRPEMARVIKEFDTLSKKQRDLLLPHLELFLEGPQKDDVWRQERANAETGQSIGDRENRAWIFFQPVPAEPRVRQPQPVTTTSMDRLFAWVSSVTVVLVVGFFGWVLLRYGAVGGLLLYLVALAGAFTAAFYDLELRFLAVRQRLMEERLRTPTRSATAPPQGGFAADVNALFKRYTAKYAPKNDRTEWENATAGIRQLDRDEIVTLYRESRTSADKVAWLIRYRIRQSLKQWRSGELYEYRERLRPRTNVVRAFWVGMAAAVLGGAGMIFMAQAHPLAEAACVIVSLSSGTWAWQCRLKIDLERRRFAADAEESLKRKADAEEELTRWRTRLERAPGDVEMAAWLACDRTMLLAKAIDHYKLARHQVIAHAFLEAPGTSAKRARVLNGPMRYSRYNLIVFVLTSDGVRQMSADLRFLKGEVRDGDRLNFRYDAVASARVSQTPRASQRSRIQQRFQLTLVNGEPVDVVVTDLDPDDFREGENQRSLENATFDAASVANTLHVLEGIAADGKAWLQSRKMGHRDS